jgi:hypothetical protein
MRPGSGELLNQSQCVVSWTEGTDCAKSTSTPSALQMLAWTYRMGSSMAVFVTAFEAVAASTGRLTSVCCGFLQLDCNDTSGLALSVSSTGVFALGQALTNTNQGTHMPHTVIDRCLAGLAPVARSAAGVDKLLVHVALCFGACCSPCKVSQGVAMAAAARVLKGHAHLRSVTRPQQPFFLLAVEGTMGALSMTLLGSVLQICPGLLGSHQLCCRLYDPYASSTVFYSRLPQLLRQPHSCCRDQGCLCMLL